MYFYVKLTVNVGKAYDINLAVQAYFNDNLKLSNKELFEDQLLFPII